jgi:hypothetical protein
MGQIRKLLHARMVLANTRSLEKNIFAIEDLLQNGLQLQLFTTIYKQLLFVKSIKMLICDNVLGFRSKCSLLLNN